MKRKNKRICIDTNIDYLSILKKIEEDAMFGVMDGPAIGAGDLIHAELPTEFDASVHTNGATSPSGCIFPKIKKYVSGKNGFFGKDDYALAKNIFNTVQKRYKEQMQKLRSGNKVEKLTCEEKIQGMNLSEEDIINAATIYARQRIADASFDAEIKNAAIYGSRTKGTAKSDSDLDIVIQYQGNEREDDMFNLLNSDDEVLGRCEIDGITIDFNPIKGDISEFLATAEKY